jgi:hypothetical protein
MIAFHQLIAVARWKARCSKQDIFLDLFANRYGQN